jgi:predicted O-linked N-acetylglucosamine transferase (SPINDLY family)
MAKLAIQQVLAAGLKHHEAGRLNEAESHYRRILARQPDHAEAMHLLGVIADQVGRHAVAVELIRKSIKIDPRIPEAHSNLGNALQSLGQLDEAIRSFQRAVVLKPDFADAHNNLGNAYLAKGEPDKALACYQRTLLLQPENAVAHHNLGVALQAKSQINDAIASYQRAVVLRPQYADAYASLGNAFVARGEFQKAIAVYRRAVSLRPDSAENHLTLGNALLDQDQTVEAIACYQRALTLKPDSPDAFNGLGNALKSQGDLDPAAAAYQQAIAIKPDLAEAHNNLGNVLAAKGQVDDAIAAYRSALNIRPDFPGAHSNLIYSLHYHPDYDAPALLAEALRWDHRHAQPLQAHWHSHDNDPSPDRRLKIGYVSPDFRDHVVGWNLLPLFREHDHQKFEIFCYSSVRRPDIYTQQLQGHADHWRAVTGMACEQVAQQIRSDRIDVLIDLALHTSSRQLLIFAAKPAPVQVTYLAYCSTSGVKAMHYRLSDPHMDPPDFDLSSYSEQTIRLPNTYWCYQPGGPTPDVSPLPALTAGHITFCCLNNFAKVSVDALELWAEILRQVPQSRLLLHSKSGSHYQAVAERFGRYGVSADRLEFVGFSPWEQYIRLHHRADIALDPFPYNGGITTCDSLWMGVPAVTLSGRTAVGRAGRSILTNVGLSELIANDPSQYVQLATDLAADLPRLTQMRASLRQRMQKSPLMNAAQFARDIESAYRQMWRNWCFRT